MHMNSFHVVVVVQPASLEAGRQLLGPRAVFMTSLQSRLLIGVGESRRQRLVDRK